MRTGRRMVFVEAGAPLESRAVEVGEPPPGYVLVHTRIAGVCGSDAHRLAGDMPVTGYPIAFGHEGIGVIEALGAGVGRDWGGTGVAVGDTVYWQPGDADCPHAAAVHQAWPPPADVPSVASYQDYALLSPADVFHRVPEDTDPEAVIAFGCAMPTALGGYARLGGVQPGQAVVVQGCGPVGLASTVLASLSPARQVVVIGAPEHRLEAARRLGATATIPLDGTTPDERAATVRELTGGLGADVVVEATGQRPAFDEGMKFLAVDGRYLVLGLYAGHGTVSVDPFRLNNLNLRIIGSLGPTHYGDYLTVIRLAQRLGDRLGFSDLVTHRFGLEKTEEAIATMGGGRAVKAVVLPGLDP